MLRMIAGSLLIVFLTTLASAADGNRLAYLDGPLDPYYPHRDFPKLITPQWVGEEGVECVVTLAIDDMRESAKYETFLRPILDRLKQIDGRAPVSIMSCRLDPADPQLQAWLKEGLSIEVHTYDHPCPCLQDGGLVKAKETYDKCVDLMNQIPGNKPVAFRMPCCDSKNTPSPRFWAEVFNKTTEKGNFLQIDSSVFNIITNKDKDLPKEITQLPDGTERFRRYVPFTNFVNTIEDYPYPYVIGGMCWEFPCVVPSDWSAQHVQKPNNPDTVRDWKLALDACVLKQGTFNLVFHPHGWIRNDQIVELIDHAVQKHGKKVKFLNFRECAERLNANLLDGKPMRLELSKRPWVFDINADGFVDVELTPIVDRLWDAKGRNWTPATRDNEFFYPRIIQPVAIPRDLDGDREVEIICGFLSGRPKDAISILKKVGEPALLPFDFPATTVTLWSQVAADHGLRLIDVNRDGKLDCLFSNHERYSLHLFKDMKEGWSIKVIEGVRGREEGNVGPVIPPFVRADGTNNGAWFHSGALWLMNEDTWRLPDNVFKLTFAEMLGKGTGDRGQGTGEPTKAQGARLDKPAVAPNGLGTQYSVLSAKKPDEQSASPASSSPSLPLSPSPPPNTPKIDMPPPLSPEDSLKVLHVRPGMKVELVAAEPLIVDPVAFDWGPDGRLWVVEMRDYPNGITWKKEGDKFGDPGGRVKVLTDENGDGKYDKAALFLDEIPFPTGVKVWRKGILITAAPEIFYAEDTNGDDKADVRKTLYRGFGEGNQQHRVNGLRWGLDGWLYVGNGDSGGVIKGIDALGTPTRRVSEGSEVNVNGRDLRIRPDTGEIEAVSGQTQFGRERDDWGNWFGGNNSDPMWHYTLDDHYLRRNPHFAPPPTRKQVSVSPGAAPVFPRSKTLKRFNDDNKANRFTSACSPMIYRDELLGSAFVGNSFVCEPVHNLVHREIVTPVGTTFTSRRADDEQTSEFLASEDSWFRPSMVRTGPDGALWVSDMYRFVIEHPKWIPEGFQKQLDLRAGDDKGRIYRIYPENTNPRPIARLDTLDSAGLVRKLGSPNGPQRDLAQQMLVWNGIQQEEATVALIAEELESDVRAQCRLQALATLDCLGVLTAKHVEQAIEDAHPALKRHGVRLSERWLGKQEDIDQTVERLASSKDPFVRQQVAYSLGSSNSPQAVNPLVRLLGDEPYIAAAAQSSLNKENIGPVLARVLADDSDQSGLRAGPVEKLLTMAAAMREDKVMATALATILKPRDIGGYEALQLKALAATIDVLKRRQKSLAEVLDEGGRQQVRDILQLAREFLTEAPDKQAQEDSHLRVAAVLLLARGLDDQDASDRKLLAGLLRPQSPPELQAAAVVGLARTAHVEVPQLCLAGWAAHTPALRGQILDALVSRDSWSQELLAAIDKGDIPATQIDARRRQQLVTSKNDVIRKRAEKALATSANTSRQQIVEQYLKAASPQDADAVRGKAVFAKRCANCHRLEGVGQTVGSDLAALNNRSRDVLLIAILDPNRAVEDRYLDYSVRLTDGRTVTGLLREETGTSITLAAAEGKIATILRSEIDSLKSSGKSLMPEGVEKDVTPSEMADLVAYLQSHSPPPKQLAGNQPEVVRPFVDGSIRLLATNARVYGPNVVLEEKYRNLGWWGTAEDYARWSFDGGEAGQYRVVLDYACENGSAGNRVLVTVGGQTLGWKVEGTGAWDDYRGKDLGVVTLAAGPGELMVRSDGPVKAALLDLRGVRLSPVK